MREHRHVTEGFSARSHSREKSYSPPTFRPSVCPHVSARLHKDFRETDTEDFYENLSRKSTGESNTLHEDVKYLSLLPRQ